jgi:hypothetical protein
MLAGQSAAELYGYSMSLWRCTAQKSSKATSPAVPLCSLFTLINTIPRRWYTMPLFSRIISIALRVGQVISAVVRLEQEFHYSYVCTAY